MIYKIIRTDGTLLGIVDKVLYIKRSENGCFVECEPREAIGVALNSTPYNLFGHDEIEDAETVLVNEVDGGAIVFEQGETQASTDTFVFSDQYMHWDGLKWVFNPENPIPLLRLPFANGIPNAFYRFTDGKRYVYVFEDRGPITEENWDEVMELWDIVDGESEGE